MVRVLRFVPSLVALALVAGCGGGQTGDTSGENSHPSDTNTGSESGCDEQLSELTPEETSALGFSAQSVLAFAAKSFQAELAWQAVQDVEYVPSASASSVTLSLSSRDQAWLVHSTPKPPSSQGGPAIDLATSCPADRLRIAVRVELGSADGALAETFDGTIDARSAYVATLSQKFVADELVGNFEVTTITAPGAIKTALENLRVDALISPGGVAGSLRGQIVTTYKEVSGNAPATFAHFPADSQCFVEGNGQPGVSVSTDNAALGQTGAEAFAAVNAGPPVSLAWTGGGTSELTLQLSGLGAGCLQVASSYGYEDPDQPAATVSYPVTLKATSADGRLQGQYPATLITWPNADGSAFSQRVSVNETYAPDAETGFTDVTVPNGVDRLTVSLQASYEGGSANGKVLLAALTDPPCVTNPQPPMGNSAPGCSGTSVESLLDGYFPR